MKKPKACFNKTCQNYLKRKKLFDTNKLQQNYCSICGSKLIPVCKGKDCFKPLPKYATEYCNECLEKREKNSNLDAVGKILKESKALIKEIDGALSSYEKVKRNK